MRTWSDVLIWKFVLKDRENKVQCSSTNISGFYGNIRARLSTFPSPEKMNSSSLYTALLQNAAAKASTVVFF
jgi:hypothetical protein